MSESQEVTLALIQKDIKYMTTGIDEVKLGIKEINARFATKEEVDERIKQIDKENLNNLNQLKDKISFLEKAVWGGIAFILYQLGQVIFKLFMK